MYLNMTFTSLFSEVVQLTKLASTLPPIDEDPTAVLCEHAGIAQNKLRDEIIEKIPIIARAAASQGRSTVDLLSFNGSQKYDDDFSYLFLLKGPRDREQKYDLYKHGFSSLFETLTHDVSPFKLTFTWVPGCNLNKLTLTWDE